jgi:hypothetical protein
LNDHLARVLSAEHTEEGVNDAVEALNQSLVHHDPPGLDVRYEQCLQIGC